METVSTVIVHSTSEQNAIEESAIQETVSKLLFSQNGKIYTPTLCTEESQAILPVQLDKACHHVKVVPDFGHNKHYHDNDFARCSSIIIS
jgi:hypothetical protein